MISPQRDALAKALGQLFEQGCEIGHGRLAAAARATSAGFLVAAQQRIEFLRHQLTVGAQLAQEGATVVVAHGMRDPRQVFVMGGQHMRLLVVQVLDAVLDTAQEHIGAG